MLCVLDFKNGATSFGEIDGLIFYSLFAASSLAVWMLTQQGQKQEVTPSYNEDPSMLYFSLVLIEVLHHFKDFKFMPCLFA